MEIPYSKDVVSNLVGDSYWAGGANTCNLKMTVMK